MSQEAQMSTSSTARRDARRASPGAGAGAWVAEHRRLVAGLLAGVLVLGAAAVVVPRLLRHAVFDDLYDGRLAGADYWTTEPAILSAGLGFVGIVGLPSLDEATVQAAGGAWATTLSCAPGVTPTADQRTSAVLSSSIAKAFVTSPGATIDHADGLPVVFSWPVRSDTIDPAQFKFTLSTGRVVFAQAAGIVPNWELNERSTVVVFGHFGNRLAYGEPGAEYPIRLDILATDKTLTLAGPDGDRSAVGLAATSDHSGYGAGPTLLGAKLTRVDPLETGENGVPALSPRTMPNDETALFAGKAGYRLRLLTSGGFSPDGVRGLRPSDYDSYFRLQARGADGSTVVLNRAGVDYHIKGGTVHVLGLSDLGKRAGGGVVYDDCYAEDRDNQVDIILSGDAAAVRNLISVQMPGTAGGYKTLFNPGGPGPTPFPGVRYTLGSPDHVQPITMALDNPMRVTRE